MLVSAVERAIELTTTDFRVVEGLRSAERQAELVAAGRSKTAHSRHQDGCAVDLVPLVDGRLAYELPLCVEIAHAMYRASVELCTPIRWGGCWMVLDGRDPMEMVRAYTARLARLSARDGRKRRPLIDGVHYELPRR